ncbi:hypothetical protein Tco_0616500, partial [Tanacetum coccineum]
FDQGVGSTSGIRACAAQLEINNQRAIKVSKRDSRFQHQTGGLSEGVSLRPEVSAKEEFKNDDEEDDASIDIQKTNAESTDIDVEYQVKGVAEMNMTKEPKEENTKRVKDQKDDEELKADEEQKGDHQAGEEQVVAHVSTTQKEMPNLLQSTSSHSVSSNFGNQFINSPNASLIGTIPENTKAEINSLLDIQIQQDVPHIHQEPLNSIKVHVIPKIAQQPPSTPPAPPLPATKIPSIQVPNSEVVKLVVQRFTKLEQAVKELKQANHSTTILESIRSQVPVMVEDYLRSSLPDALKKAVKDALEKTPLPFAQSSSPDQSVITVAESLFDYELKKILYAKMHKSQSHLTHDIHQELYDALTWSMLHDEANTKEAGSNQGKKTKKRRFNETESSKKTSTTKESSKGKYLAKTSKYGKSVTAKESVEEPVFKMALDDVEQTFDDKGGDAGQPPHTDADET